MKCDQGFNKRQISTHYLWTQRQETICPPPKKKETICPVGSKKLQEEVEFESWCEE